MTNNEQARLLLPWYVTGALDEADRQLVERALEESQELQHELEEQDFIQNLVKQDTSVLDISVVNTVDQRLDDLLTRIDHYENVKEDSFEGVEAKKQAGITFIDSVKSLMSQLFTFQAVRYAAVGAVLVFAVQLVVMTSMELVNPNLPSSPELSDEEPGTVDENDQDVEEIRNSDVKFVVAMFDKNLSDAANKETLDKILNELKAKPVSEKSSKGHFVLELTDPMPKAEFDKTSDRLKSIAGVEQILKGADSSEGTRK